jgi:hypothetical protein
MQFFYLFGCREMIAQREYMSHSRESAGTAEIGCEQLQQATTYSITPGSAMSALGQKRTLITFTRLPRRRSRVRPTERSGRVLSLS